MKNRLIIKKTTDGATTKNKTRSKLEDKEKLKQLIEILVAKSDLKIENF